MREWRMRDSECLGRVFTCGRPGRGTEGYQRKYRRVDDDTINRWIAGLPQTDIVHIVSLLGRKTNGCSEFIYYPFRSVTERGTDPTFQEWLDDRYPLRFVVREFPTVDARGIETDVLESVKQCVLGLLAANQTVVILDSAGAQPVTTTPMDVVIACA